MRRIEVFSLKGGAGKTTVSWLLARALARDGGKVLLVDADLAGSCLGDFLAADAIWNGHDNLAHLVCSLPELLPEALAPGRLPVYLSRLDNSQPLRLGAASPMENLYFCPSHLYSVSTETHPRPDARVLQALMNHESAGGWVNEVIDQVIAATSRSVLDGLAAVVVDHAPGLAAVQRTALGRVDGKEHRAVLVASCDRADLASVAAHFDTLDIEHARAFERDHPGTSLEPRARVADPVVTLNRHVAASTFQDKGPWFQEAVTLRFSPTLAGHSLAGTVASFTDAALEGDITELLARLK